MKFLIFGQLPPPVGGVTISIKNLTTALSSLNIHNEIIRPNHLLKIKSFDIGHIHYSRRTKVLLGILLSKLLCKKTIMTKHGAGFYPKTNLWDKIFLHLIDGIIVLNDEVYHRCLHKKNLIKLPPIFEEGILNNKTNQPSYFKKENGFKYLLLYASNKAYIDNKEVYGVHFILNLLDKFDEDIKIILLDPNAAYQEDINTITSKKLIYIDKFVDFNALVSTVDLYIRPTTSDGNSIATLEALSAGIPVLASNVVERDKNILTYEVLNEKDFISQVKTLLSKETPQERYKFETVQAYLDFCTTILKKKNS